MEVIESEKSKHNILVYCSSKSDILMECHQQLIEALILTGAGSVARIDNLSFSCLAGNVSTVSAGRETEPRLDGSEEMQKEAQQPSSINILIMLTLNVHQTAGSFRWTTRARLWMIDPPPTVWQRKDAPCQLLPTHYKRSVLFKICSPTHPGGLKWVMVT